MEDNKNFDLETIMDELSDRLEDMIEDALADQVEDAVTCAIQDVFEEALSESLSRFEFVLDNGTIVKPRQLMKLVSPDKAKMVLCYGGLRVDGTSLMVQTRISCWESIAYYQSREEAIEALARVRQAMEANLPVFEL